ncbi:predicted protein [Chaetoceros tenuissimus]|uniref:Uncharacterized protein n=1 Tax=Chaetoceros tenuissimus TaxID=426638 RepID=A0AAD3D376_9STRA|nr:predicted protein [Chaetoceros tenuissimus]
MADAKNKPSLSTETIVDKKLANETAGLNKDLAKLSLNMAVVKDLKKIVDKQSSEITKINDNIVTINENLDGIKNIMEQQLRWQQWSFVLANNSEVPVALISFKYRIGEDLEEISSAGLVTEILQSFASGCGHYLPDNAYIVCWHNNKKEARKAFRTGIKSQVKKMIGHEPRLEKGSDGRYAIYYT